MKKLLLLFFIALSAQLSFAQLNVTYISDYGYSQNLNDIWGYAAPDGTEYALVGVRNGFSILSLADPANPFEVAFIPGGATTWRDIKTWGETAYVTCDSCDDGLLVVDLSDLPNSAPSYFVTDVPGLGTLGACHNIYIDEFGYAYLAGCSLNNGGMIYFDCFSTPGTPNYVDLAPNVYAHDVYVRNNKMYASEIYDGQFTIYDVSDKNNTIALGSQTTEFNFTHNAWLSDDGNFLFTTDEQGNAPVGSYDVSDPSNILEMDQFRPIETLGEGVIPHNVHVWNDYIITSYYTDGCIIVDGSRPDNLIEVGNFDTFIPTSTGFDGAWGAYPFLPSGLVLISDIGNGCYILQPNYVRACWLEGFITDGVTGLPIPGATVDIQSTQPNMGASDATGEYKTGQALNGSFEVIYAAPGYISQTITVELENGVLTMQDVQLLPESSNAVSGQIVLVANGNPVDGAMVNMVSDQFFFETTTDLNGNFSFPAVFSGTYQVYAGGWGYHTAVVNQTINETVNNIVVELEEGYSDNFAMDLGWTIVDQAGSGTWELGTPNGTTFQGSPSNPGVDNANDVGTQCYVTGNGGGDAGTDDVDDGVTILTSPVMDLSDYETAQLSYDKWFFNDGGQGNPNDNLLITVSNGNTIVELEDITNSNSSWSNSTFILNDFITLTDNMQVSFETSDSNNSGHLVEAAVDVFNVTELNQVTAPEIAFNITEGCSPLEVTFEGISDIATSFSWSFPGGNPSTSTAQNPTVTFSTPGTFDVSLAIDSPNGSSFAMEENLIVVNGPPVADFSYSISGGNVNFNNTSEGATAYSWEFGDAAGSTSNDASPSFFYPVAGTYEIVLFVSNECGGGVIMETIEINVTSTFDLENTVSLNATPNPFTTALMVDYDYSQMNASVAVLNVFNVVGQKIEQVNINDNKGQVQIGDNLNPGVYFLQLEIDGKVNRSMKLIKQ